MMYRQIEFNIPIFSAKHTAMILISMCLYTVADLHDIKIVGYTFDGGENETNN